MVSFLYNELLLLLLAVPFIVWLSRKTSPQNIIALHLRRAKRLSRQQYMLPLLFMTGFIIAILALAGPTLLNDDAPFSELKYPRVMVIDMSSVMALTDVQPSRYQQALFKLQDLVGQYRDGYNAVIAYTNFGYLISPLTHDHSALFAQLNGLSPQIMPTQGRNAKHGLEKAITLLKQARYEFGDIVLFTSGIGETEREDIAQLLEPYHYRLSVFTFATEQGAPILASSGNPILNKQGLPIISRLQLQQARSLAGQFNGIAIQYSTTNDDIERLSQLEPRYLHDQDLSDVLRHHYVDIGYWLVWPLAILCLLLFRKGALWVLLLILYLPAENALAHQSWSIYKNGNRMGFEAFNAKNFSLAARLFDDPAWQGVAFYEAGDYQNAVHAFVQIKDGSSNYNLATALAKLGKLNQAKTLYLSILKETPNHALASKNLELVNSALAKQELQPPNQESEESEESEESGKSKSEGPPQNSKSNLNKLNDNSPSSKDSSAKSEPSNNTNNAQHPNKSSSEVEQALLAKLKNSRGDKNASISDLNQYDVDQFAPTYSNKKSSHHQIETNSSKTDSLSNTEGSKHSPSLQNSNSVLNQLSQLQAPMESLLKNRLREQALRFEVKKVGQVDWSE